MKLIDTDALIETIKEISHYDDHDVLVVDWDDMMIRIDMDEALTIDAEPVVRCKDCMYADSYYHCTWTNFWGTADDYCSRAKPKMYLDEVNDE